MEIEVSKFFLEIDEHLRTKNRFSLLTESEARVQLFCSHYINNLTEVASGTEYWRSRLWGVNQTENFSFHEMGAPPSQLTRQGRINPEGISYLYGASDKQTAIAEVRPWVGANLSVAKLKIVRNLKLVDLTKVPQRSFNSREHTERETFLGLQLAINSTFINKLFFAAPAHEHDRLAYITSQFLSERFKAMGADGIIYPSVLNEGGFNICIFDPNLAQIKNGICKSTVRAIKIDAI